MKKKAIVRKVAETEAKFPYTTKPSSLRRLLQAIPKKPKPPKFDKNTLRSWGFTDANDYSMLRVLKAVGLLGEKNEPTQLYEKYMDLSSGPAVLADPIKRLYQPLFVASHEPFKEPAEKLQNLFNIHSGGGDRSLDQQIQTFKALCENADFGQSGKPPIRKEHIPGENDNGSNSTLQTNVAGIHINLHIHLPENKSPRDYERIIEDIGHYIFQRPTDLKAGTDE